MWLFFASLLLCLIDIAFEGLGSWCRREREAAMRCGAAEAFEVDWRSLVLFLAGIAPVLSAAIHGILSTTEYTKLAQISTETAGRIYVLYETLAAIDAADVEATPQVLAPISAVVQQFAEEVIEEATGWKAMLRDKNLPLA